MGPDGWLSSAERRELDRFAEHLVWEVEAIGQPAVGACLGARLFIRSPHQSAAESIGGTARPSAQRRACQQISVHFGQVTEARALPSSLDFVVRPPACHR
jgi:hypothetical protein